VCLRVYEAIPDAQRIATKVEKMWLRGQHGRAVHSWAQATCATKPFWVCDLPDCAPLCFSCAISADCRNPRALLAGSAGRQGF
jgi:hypothetical protein